MEPCSFGARTWLVVPQLLVTEALSWAHAAKKMGAPSLSSSQSGAVASPWEGKGVSVSYLHPPQPRDADTVFQAGTAERTGSFLLYPAPSVVSKIYPKCRCPRILRPIWSHPGSPTVWRLHAWKGKVRRPGLPLSLLPTPRHPHCPPSAHSYNRIVTPGKMCPCPHLWCSGSGVQPSRKSGCKE